MDLKKNDYIKRFVNFFLNILIFLFGVILLISIYTGVQTKVLGNKYTNFFGYSIFEVQTGSMSGAIDAGDWIIVKLTKDVRLNDVITYESKGEYITHRIIEVYKGTYITKGDANNAKDDPVDQSQVIGKVSSVLANFGILRKTVFNPMVLLTLIITLLLFNFAFKKDSNNEVKVVKKIFQSGKLEKIRVSILGFIKKAKEIIIRFIKKIIKFCKDQYVKIKDRYASKIEKKSAVDDSKKVDEDIVVLNDEGVHIDNSNDSYNDDEFSKTSLYRVISVDSFDVDDKFKPLSAPVNQEEEKEESYEKEEDLDKTSLYSVIPVDLSEINDTFLEIAENEVTSQKANDDATLNKKGVEDIKAHDNEEVEEDESLTKINLDLLKNKRGSKGKNVIDSIVFIKKEEISELIALFLDENKIYTSKATIKESYMNAYIEARYYNCHINSEQYMAKNGLLKTEKVIDDVTSFLLKKDSNNKYALAVETYASAFTLIDLLEKAKTSITDLKVKREYYKKVILKQFKNLSNSNIERIVEDAIKIQKKYASMVQYFLKSFDTNTFILNTKKLNNKINMYISNLEHNINFSKVYSEYIIDKTYAEGIVAEDKVMILFTLLSVQLVRDMLSSSFNKKYLLCMPSSLYEKEKKIEKLLRLIDDQYAKENVVILINPKDLLNNKQVVKNIKKLGYKFALVFNHDINLKEKDRSSIYIMDYIFINKKAVDSNKILPFIPDDLSDKVIYEEFGEDIENFWGDKV